MSLEKNTPVNKPSSVENQTSQADKLERTSAADERVEQTPKTVKGQIAEMIKALGTADPSSRDFLLRVVQPGLAGLMDGSVSTLAPIFATAFATHRAFYAFLVGMAAATGAGISMAFSEALSDDGVLTGRGDPIMRGAITGFMTFMGGAGHTLPFLVPDFRIALAVAFVVVGVELIVIA